MFQSPKDLVNCFEALENDGRLDIVAVSNGFLASVADDENPKPTSAPHEVALAVEDVGRRLAEEEEVEHLL